MPPIAVLVALADPTRCRIVEILSSGSQPVHVLAGAFSISRPAISRHLRVLKHAKLISETKTGRENRYALHTDKLKPVAQWLADIRDAKPLGRAGKKVSDKPAVKLEAPAVVPVVDKPTPVVRAPARSESQVPTKAIKPRREPALLVSATLSQMGFDF